MATIALHYPVKVLSLSPSALDRGEGIWHYVKSVEGPAMFRIPDTQNSWDADPDAIHVVTVCGKEISAYPETNQQRSRPCVRCIKPERHLESMTRLIPPVRECEGRWVQYYWGTSGNDVRNGGLFA